MHAWLISVHDRCNNEPWTIPRLISTISRDINPARNRSARVTKADLRDRWWSARANVSGWTDDRQTDWQTSENKKTRSSLNCRAINVDSWIFWSGNPSGWRASLPRYHCALPYFPPHFNAYRSLDELTGRHFVCPRTIKFEPLNAER